ncbi:MAG: transcriptional regulator [Acidobacteriota bacterium]
MRTFATNPSESFRNVPKDGDAAMQKTNYLFGQFTVNTEKRELFCANEIVPLSSRAFDLLIVLIDRRGNFVSKQELIDVVWEGNLVEDSNLTVQISALRKALREKKGERVFILTRPGRGYQFVEEVTEIEEVDLVRVGDIIIDPPVDTSVRRNRNLRVILPAGSLIFLIAIGVWLRGAFSVHHATFEQTRISAFTNSGKIRLATFSPDGKFVAFVQTERGGQSLWLKQYETKSEKQIVPPGNIDYLGITVSPDNNISIARPWKTTILIPWFSASLFSVVPGKESVFRPQQLLLSLPMAAESLTPIPTIRRSRQVFMWRMPTVVTRKFWLRAVIRVFFPPTEDPRWPGRPTGKRSLQSLKMLRAALDLRVLLASTFGPERKCR